MEYFSYPAKITPDLDDGGFVVTFRDLPEAITQGDTIEECLSQASDCLGESLAFRIDDNLEIPVADRPENGEYLVPVPLTIARKAKIYSLMRERKLSIDRVASLLEVDKQKVRCLLDPRDSVNSDLEKKTLSVLKSLGMNP